MCRRLRATLPSCRPCASRRSRLPTVRSSSSTASDPEPARNTVRVAVEACGICHSDSLTKPAAFPGIALPACAGARGGRPHRCDRVRRRRVDDRPARRRRLARRLLRALRSVPARPVLRLRHRAAGHRHHARRRLRRVHDRARHVARAGARRAVRRPTPLRSCVQASRRSTRCGTAARARAISSRSTGSAVSGTSACSSPARWASTPSPSRAAPTRRRSPRRWAPIATSTAPPRIPRRRSPRWAAHASCSRPSPTVKR